MAGRFDEARHWQETAARAWLGLHDSAQLSFPLSEWFRIAALVDDADAALADVERFCDDAARCGLDAASGSFVRLARAMAHRRIHGSSSTVVAALQHLANDTGPQAGGSAGLAAAALRELVACGGVVGDDARARLRSMGTKHIVYERLVALDDALRSGDGDEAAAVIDALATTESMARSIVSRWRDEGRSPRRIADEFPYWRRLHVCRRRRRSAAGMARRLSLVLDRGDRAATAGRRSTA